MIDFVSADISDKEMENLVREVCREILNRANIDVSPNLCPLCEQ